MIDTQKEQGEQGDQEEQDNLMEQEVSEAITYHSSALCRIMEESEALGLNNEITIRGEDGRAIVEFDLHIRRRKAGARRESAWNRMFAGYGLAILPTLLASAIAMHVGLPVWKLLLVMSLTIALSLCITTTGIRHTQH
jgi:hypothetical protein